MFWRAIAIFVLFAVGPVSAETLRVATYNAGLSRSGPGVLLADLQKPPKEEIATALGVIQAVRPDVILLSRIDYDLRGRALDALAMRLAEGPDGIDYPHRYVAPVNSGVPTGRDLDGDTLKMGRGDAFGWGAFPGDGGMGILSRFPIDDAAARTFQNFLWADLGYRSLYHPQTFFGLGLFERFHSVGFHGVTPTDRWTGISIRCHT